MMWRKKRAIARDESREWTLGEVDLPSLAIDALDPVLSLESVPVENRTLQPARRPDPGYVDAAKLLPLAYVVGLSLLVMGVVLIVGDLVVPVQPLS